MKALLLALLPTAFFCNDGALNTGTKWTAVLTVGTARDCFIGANNARWEITERDGKLSAVSEDKRGRWEIDTSGLSADGSGRVHLKDGKGKPMWVQLEAGHGPRNIYFNVNYQACVWQLMPR